MLRDYNSEIVPPELEIVNKNWYYYEIPRPRLNEFPT
jgi:hypothetical protein